ncbi:hypothetical protein D3C86_2232730 [compost metagenome]
MPGGSGAGERSKSKLENVAPLTPAVKAGRFPTPAAAVKKDGIQLEVEQLSFSF